MFVSVILPVYNGACFIEAALQSIQQQAHTALEIIVVDDGSTDETAAAIAHSGIAVRYTYQENAGAQHARNVGLALAHGALITFLDADDVWSADKLRIQLGLLANHDIVIGHSCLLTGDKRPFLFLNLAAALFRRETFETIGRFEPMLGTTDDLDWFMRAREHGLQICVHDDIVLYHRRHANNLTKRKAAQNRHEFLQMLHRSLQRRRTGGQIEQPQFGQLRGGK